MVFERILIFKVKLILLKNFRKHLIVDMWVDEYLVAWLIAKMPGDCGLYKKTFFEKVWVVDKIVNSGWSE